MAVLPDLLNARPASGPPRSEGRGTRSGPTGEPTDAGPTAFASVLGDRIERREPARATKAELGDAVPRSGNAEAADAKRSEVAENVQAVVGAMVDRLRAAQGDLAAEIAAGTVAAAAHGAESPRSEPSTADQPADIDASQEIQMLAASEPSPVAAAPVLIAAPAIPVLVTALPNPVKQTTASAAATPALGAEMPVLGAEMQQQAVGGPPQDIAAVSFTAPDPGHEQAPAGFGEREPGQDFSQLLARSPTASNPAAHTPQNPQAVATHAASGTESIALQQPAGRDSWRNELGERMVWMANTQRQQADLVLNPPQLGRIEVSLSISGDQANAVFGSPNATVREMIENSLPRLREILAGAGIDLGEAQINGGAAQQQDNREQPSRRTLTAGGDAASGLQPLPTTQLGSWRQGRGLVDTFV